MDSETPAPSADEVGPAAAGEAPAAPERSQAAEALAKLRRPLEPAIQFVRLRLVDMVEIFFLGVIVLALGMSIVNQSFVFTGRALSASIIGFALCFLITSRNLRRWEGLGNERIFLSLAVMVSGVWLFEICYHYGFPGAWTLLPRSLTTFEINTPTQGRPFPLPWAILMVALMFTGIKYMRLNRWFYLCVGLAALSLWFWVAVGYPSYFNPERWPSKDPVIDLIPSPYAHPTTAEARAAVSFWGGALNSTAKILVCMIPATLFFPGKERKGGAQGEPKHRFFPKVVYQLAARLPIGRPKLARGEEATRLEGPPPRALGASASTRRLRALRSEPSRPHSRGRRPRPRG